MTDAKAKTAAMRSVEIAEEKVQRIMLDLDEEIAAAGVCVGHVDVDTRNYAQMRVEITLNEIPKGGKR